MTNEEMIDKLDKIHFYKEELDSVNKLIAKKTERQKELINIIETLELITSVHNGIALKFYQASSGKNESIYIGAVDDSICRRGYLYLNQHNYKTWGLTLYDKKTDDGKFGINGERWMGANFETRDEVMQIVLNWVTKGKI